MKAVCNIAILFVSILFFSLGTARPEEAQKLKLCPIYGLTLPDNLMKDILSPNSCRVDVHYSENTKVLGVVYPEKIILFDNDKGILTQVEKKFPRLFFHQDTIGLWYFSEYVLVYDEFSVMDKRWERKAALCFSPMAYLVVDGVLFAIEYINNEDECALHVHKWDGKDTVIAKIPSKPGLSGCSIIVDGGKSYISQYFTVWENEADPVEFVENACVFDGTVRVTCVDNKTGEGNWDKSMMSCGRLFSSGARNGYNGDSLLFPLWYDYQAGGGPHIKDRVMIQKKTGEIYHGMPLNNYIGGNLFCIGKEIYEGMYGESTLDMNHYYLYDGVLEKIISKEPTPSQRIGMINGETLVLRAEGICLMTTTGILKDVLKSWKNPWDVRRVIGYDNVFIRRQETTCEILRVVYE